MPQAPYKSSYTFRLNPNVHHEEAPMPQYDFITSYSDEDFIPTTPPSSDSLEDALVHAPGSSLYSIATPESQPSPTHSSSSSETYAHAWSDTSSPSYIPRSSSSRRKPAGHIPRPRNAFIIFRSEFCSSAVITQGTERDHRHISRIIGHIWKQMSEKEKYPWHQKADDEKLLHAKMHPNYQFTPCHRVNKPIKRKVKRNSAADLERCRQVAKLCLAGKKGEELEKEVELLPSPDTSASGSETVSPKKSRKRASTASLKGSRKYKEVNEEPAFRSPLLARFEPGSPIGEMSASEVSSAPHVLPPHESNIAEIQFVHEVFPGQWLPTQPMAPEDSGVGSPLQQVPTPTQPTPYLDFSPSPTFDNLAYMGGLTAFAPASSRGLTTRDFIEPSPEDQAVVRGMVPYIGWASGLQVDHYAAHLEWLFSCTPTLSSTAQIYPPVGSLVDSSSEPIDWRSTSYAAHCR